jgi:hypothetical protein
VNARLRRKITGTRGAKTTDTKTEKKRAYFCCIGKSIDIYKLHEYLTEDFFAASTAWKYYLIGSTTQLLNTAVKIL